MQVFIDDFSKATTVVQNVPIGMDESPANLQAHDQALFTRTGNHVRTWRFDNGSEYDDHKLRSFAKDYPDSTTFYLDSGQCKALPSPTTGNRIDALTPSTEKEQEEMIGVPFRSALGCLMWIMTNTRPDIAFVAHQIARRTADPRPSDWIALKRILRYLRGTPTKGVLYKRSEPSIQCFSDSDWAGDSSRRTTACSLIYFGGAISGAIIHWQFLRDKMVQDFEQVIN